ncbi:MAG TPA: hypothetical protein VD996_15355 [Chitinophagaceae bacterium]|nr:hypothetical protein [Chitinophagaceae bacterium]
MIRLLLIMTLLISAMSCHKTENTQRDELITEISRTTGSTDILTIEKIERNNTDKGYYTIVTFRRKDGSVSNMVFSSFLMKLVADKFILHTSEDTKAAACYKFWCTTAGNCTSCQVLVDDPFGSPTLRCSCDGCHLHGQQVQCPQ